MFTETENAEIEEAEITEHTDLTQRRRDTESVLYKNKSLFSASPCLCVMAVSSASSVSSISVFSVSVSS